MLCNFCGNVIDDNLNVCPMCGQKNKSIKEDNIKEESAFAKALNGSKLFLKVQGFLKNEN